MTKTKFRVTYGTGDGTMKEATLTEDEDFADRVVQMCYDAGATFVRKEEL